MRKRYPTYEMVKNKITLDSKTDIDQLLKKLEESYSGEQTNRVDGLKIDFEKGWIHLRKSNTEPIIRIYAEAETKEEAEAMVGDLMKKMEEVGED